MSTARTAAHRVPGGGGLVIHDAQYTLEEYPARLTWGHTPAELAVDSAGAARATRLALFHHDPRAPTTPSTRCWPAAGRVRPPAGWRCSPPPRASWPSNRRGRRPGAAARAPSSTAGRPRGGHPAGGRRAGHRPPPHEDAGRRGVPPAVRERRRGGAEDRAPGAPRPRGPRLYHARADGLAVCRALRADPDPRLREVPVVLITGRAEPADTAAGFAAGVTHYLTKPFKPSHLLARLEVWLVCPRRPLC